MKIGSDALKTPRYKVRDRGREREIQRLKNRLESFKNRKFNMGLVGFGELEVNKHVVYQLEQKLRKLGVRVKSLYPDFSIEGHQYCPYCKKMGLNK